MSDPAHPTNKDWELFDPVLYPPPSGNLLLINEGGCLITGPWYPGAQAWGFKPVVPASVKVRRGQRLQEKQQESEPFHATQPEGGSPDPA